jgi:hypothetical protein
MRFILGIFPLILLCFANLNASADTWKLLHSFETQEDINRATGHFATIQSTDKGVTNGKKALLVTFETKQWPNVFFSMTHPQDWSNYGGLALDITNPGQKSVNFNIRIDDDVKANGVTHCITGTGKIEAGETKSFICTFSQNPMLYGMRGLPSADPSCIEMSVGSGYVLNTKHIVAFQVFLDHPTQPVTLIIDNIRLSPKVNLDGIVDRFGQYAKGDWPGKLLNESEFKTRLQEENRDLAEHPAMTGRDIYGGWEKGPQLKATGFFRTTKYNGKWWLVDPIGHLFFSMGIDCVNTANATMISGREYMFTWLPKEGDPLSQFYGYASSVLYGPVKQGRTYNFFGANLYRKYGPDFLNIWKKREITRLISWGFNTIGNWSDQSYYRNERIPYVATGGIGGDHRRISSGSDYWGKMHDPFDPQFAIDVRNSLDPLIQKVKNDPWCIGYFIDNELSWGGGGDDGGRYGLAYGALKEDGSSPAKQAFINELKTKYGDITALNKAWGANFANWDALEPSWSPTGHLNQAMTKDFGAFVYSLALKYFTIVHDELHRLNPNHLYLGCRFAWKTPEAMEAAAKVCDVVSFNIYAPRLNPKAWAFTKAFNKPCIIGEFHFGSLDRGMFSPGLVYAPNQKARAAMFIDYLHSVLDNPSFVGCHWFQLVDEPLTGRSFDGENYNIGFLNVTDTPYPEMVTAAREVLSDAYQRRLK